MDKKILDSINDELLVLENRTQAMVKSIAKLANDTELLRQKFMEVKANESKRSINKSVPSKRRK